ncbi:7483_t:CDS:2, partial [Racocetra fulgida]
QEYNNTDYTKIFTDIFFRDLTSYPLLKQAEKVSNRIDTTQLDVSQAVDKLVEFTESEIDNLLDKKGYEIANEIEDEILDEELKEDKGIIEELEDVYKTKLSLLKDLEKQIKLRYPDKYEDYVKNMTGVKTGASFQH